MPIRLRDALLLPLLCLSTSFALAQSPTPQPAGAPQIAQIDPPNWWAALPAPMLLVHGENLAEAKFSLVAKGVSIGRQQRSANGHWAILWLTSKSDAPQQIQLLASNRVGSARAEYALAARTNATIGFAGFSADDAMELIMPDRYADGDKANDAPAGLESTYDPHRANAYHGGDLRGIDAHLEYLQQLGTNTLWLTPVYDNSLDHSGTSYHGYSATNMFAVDPHLGSMADLQKLSQDLHSRGMKLVLDTVPNHVGPLHPWAQDQPLQEWLHGTPAAHLRAREDLAPASDPHGSLRDQAGLLDGWFVDLLPDLNQRNPAVSQYLIQNAIWWIESAHLDGLRLDTFPFVDRGFWHDFHAELHQLYPHLTTVGEVWHEDPAEVSYFAGGVAHASEAASAAVDTGLDTPFDFPMYFALRAALIHGEPMTRIARVLRMDALYPHPERLVTFLGNHDTMRFLSEPGATTDALKLGFGLLATMRGMPQFYYGDEVALRGGNDPDNRHDFPGGMATADHDAFQPSGRTAEEAEMHDWLAGMLALRSAHPALRTGNQQNLFADQNLFAFTRSSQQETILVVANKAQVPQNLSMELGATSLESATLLSGITAQSPSAQISKQRLSLTMPPHSFAVYKVTQSR